MGGGMGGGSSGAWGGQSQQRGMGGASGGYGGGYSNSGGSQLMLHILLLEVLSFISEELIIDMYTTAMAETKGGNWLRPVSGPVFKEVALTLHFSTMAPSFLPSPLNY